MFKLLLVALYIWPMIHVIISPRSTGSARVGWFILMLLFSLPAYAVYLVVTQKNLAGPN